MTRITASAFALLLVAGSALGADRYWVGGAGTWNDPAHWSTTSGGAGGSTPPGATDRAIFDANSGAGTCNQQNATIDVVGIVMNAPNITLAQSKNKNRSITVGASGFTLTAGTFAGNKASITINGPFNMSGGNFRATSNTWTMNGSFTFNGGTLNANGGLFTVTSGTCAMSGTATPTFSRITVGAGATLQARPGTVNVTDNFVNDGTFDANGGTMVFSGATTIGGTSTTTLNNVSITGTLAAPAATLNVTGSFTNNGTFTHNGGTLVFSGTTTVGGASPTSFNNVSITGTLAAPAGTMNVAGNWAMTGTFNHGGGTVNFNGAGQSTISGNSTFRNLSCSTAGKQLNFAAGSTQTVNGTFSATGAPGTPVVLRSTVAGSAWNIDFPNGVQAVNYVDVRDSNALTNDIYAGASTDSGNNNAHWIFANILRYWVGGTGSWNDPAHWALFSGGPGGASVPVNTQLAVFDGNSGGGTCTVNQAVSVLGLMLLAGNTVTLNQGGNAIAVGTAGFQQQAGTFVGGSGAMSVAGPFGLIGGTFAAPGAAGTLSLADNFLFNANVGAVFNHNGGTVVFNGAASEVLGNGTPTFNNLAVTGTLLGRAGVMNVAGNWTNNGTFSANGGTVAFTGAGLSSAVGGTSTTTFNALTIGAGHTLTAPAALMNVAGNWTNGGTFNANGGTVGFSGATAIGGASTNSFSNVSITGTLTAPAGTTNVAGNWTNNGTFVANGGTVVLNGSGAQSIAGASDSSFYRLTVSSGTTTVNTDTTVANTAQIAAGAGMTVAPATTLALDTGLTLNGALDLWPDATLQTDGNITAAVGSTFRVSGNSQLPGGYATIEAGSGSYTMSLSGNVDMRFARVYDLGNTGMALGGGAGSTAVLDNVVFYNGAAGATPYLRITGAAWNGHNFIGMGFAASGTKSRAIQITTGGTVFVNGYASDAGWLSGDATDIETSGSIVWGPTAAEGLAAEVRQTPKGNLVTWFASLERGTMGYVVLRRCVESASGLLDEEADGRLPAGHRGETVIGPWKVVAEVPPTAPGGEPVERSYNHLDKAPAGNWEYEVREVQSVGLPGTARALTKEAQP